MEVSDPIPGCKLWGCWEKTLGTSIEIGTGKENTALMVQACEAGTAAHSANDFTLNGYDDWYLPSKKELDLMYAQLDILGNGNLYWSSSEGGLYSAWMLVFADSSSGFTGPGTWHDWNKENCDVVRPIRSF